MVTLPGLDGVSSAANRRVCCLNENGEPWAKQTSVQCLACRRAYSDNEHNSEISLLDQGDVSCILRYHAISSLIHLSQVILEPASLCKHEDDRRDIGAGRPFLRAWRGGEAMLMDEFKIPCTFNCQLHKWILADHMKHTWNPFEYPFAKSLIVVEDTARPVLITEYTQRWIYAKTDLLQLDFRTGDDDMETACNFFGVPPHRSVLVEDSARPCLMIE